MAKVQSIALHAGAAAMKRLLVQVRDKGNADLAAFWEAHPDQEGVDGRDYRAIGEIVRKAIEANLHHRSPAHREGFLRALTDLLCIEADECGDTVEGWAPISITAHSFEGAS